MSTSAASTTSAPSCRADGRDQDADALQVLCRHHNGHHPFIDAKGNVYATRPDKPSGISASVGYVGPGIVKVFTDNWKPFRKRTVRHR